MKRNWDQIKDEERGSERESQMDGIPSALPAIQRASPRSRTVGEGRVRLVRGVEVLPKVRRSWTSLRRSSPIPRGRVELGDVLFSVINLLNAPRHRR